MNETLSFSASQRACQAIKYQEETLGHSPSHGGNRRGPDWMTGADENATDTAIAKRYSVGLTLLKAARRLLKNDPNRFEEVLAGFGSLISASPKEKNVGNQSYALYRAWDEFGTLLYVGITWGDDQEMQNGNAWRQSRKVSQNRWWVEFTTMSVDRSFCSKEQLEEAERLAVETEMPLYNVLFTL